MVEDKYLSTLVKYEVSRVQSLNQINVVETGLMVEACRYCNPDSDKPKAKIYQRIN